MRWNYRPGMQYVGPLDRKMLFYGFSLVNPQLKLFCPSPELSGSVALFYTQGSKPPRHLLTKPSKFLALMVANKYILLAPFLHVLKTRPALFVWEGSRV